MAKAPVAQSAVSSEALSERRGRPRDAPRADEQWHTGITLIEPNKIVVRGYAVDELMGRISFAEAIYLLQIGEMPTPAIGRLMEALLVSTIDHGVTPPSTMAARNAATTGASLQACVSAGVAAIGPYHGGDIESCMRFFDAGLARVRAGASYHDAAQELVQRYEGSQEPPPGFGHRFHTRDPRAARLFQMALELEIEGAHMQMARAVEHALAEAASHDRPLPINVDGAIAAVCGDLGLPVEIGNALFLISRVPGLIAQALEERSRHPPMRQISPKDHVYDGPRDRRASETRR